MRQGGPQRANSGIVVVLARFEPRDLQRQFGIVLLQPRRLQQRLAPAIVVARRTMNLRQREERHDTLPARAAALFKLLDQLRRAPRLLRRLRPRLEPAHLRAQVRSILIERRINAQRVRHAPAVAISIRQLRADVLVALELPRRAPQHVERLRVLA